MATTTPAAGETLIDVRSVATRFGSAEVHRDISLTVRRGEVFAIAGGSGCGKSVLLREILLLQRPTTGEIRLFGQDSATMTEADVLAFRRRTGMLFQQGALFSSLTVAENVAVPLHEHTRLSPELIREVAAIKIGQARLPATAGAKLPSELSGGMRKRAALARAIALDPELLFLDEPTAGLDPVSAGAFDQLVWDLKTLLGLTIVMVTHDLDTLWRVADRVAVLGEGRVLALGTMAEVARSMEPFIREYFHGERGRAAAVAREAHGN